jgi:hypothetical protein
VETTPVYRLCDSVMVTLDAKASGVMRSCGRWSALLILALCFVLITDISARTRPARNRAGLDDAYISALAVANRFLQAWQSHDQETAVLLLTNAAKQHCSEDRLDSFFSTDSRAAYEIGRGRKLQTGRYVFPLTIFVGSGASSRASARPHYTELIVTKTGKNDWAVDKLP